MDKFILTLYLLSCSIFLYTQALNEIPLGKVTYSYKTDFALTLYGTSGEAILYFNNTMTYYRHTSVPAGDIINEEGMEINLIRGDSYGFPVITDQVNKKVISRIPIDDEKSLLEEPLEKVNWIIKKDTSKLIEGFLCNLAFGESYGRTYLVWFARDIPIQGGPYKLTGLPGLILEGRSLDDKVTFNFTSLTLSNNIDFKMVIPESKIKIKGICSFKKKIDEIRVKTNIEFVAKGWEPIDWEEFDEQVGEDNKIEKYRQPCK